MRTALLSFCLLSFVACGGSPDADPAGPVADDAPVPPTRGGGATAMPAAPSSSSSDASTVPAVDVHGTVIDFAGKPAANVAITLIDAQGRKTVTETDAAGTFAVPAVVAPYDLDASSGYPLVFIGLTTASPEIRHPGATKTPPITSRKATLVTAIDFPSCPTAWCSAQIASGSMKTGGSGRVYTGFSGEPHRSPVLEIEHEWTGAATSDTVDVDVLLYDSTYTAFWHQKLETKAVVNEGAWIPLYAAAPKPVPRVGPTLVIGVAASVPSDWRKEAHVSLRLPGQPGAFTMQSSDATNFVTHLPSIPGATYTVSAGRAAETVEDPVSGARLHDERCGAMTKEIPIAKTDTIVMGLVRGPSIATPKLLATMSRGTAELSFAPAPGRLVQLWISGKKLAATVFVMGTSVSLSLARLAELGIVLEDGRHRLELVTFPGTAVEEILDDPYAAWSSPSFSDESLVFDVVP